MHVGVQRWGTSKPLESTTSHGEHDDVSGCGWKKWMQFVRTTTHSYHIIGSILYYHIDIVYDIPIAS